MRRTFLLLLVLGVVSSPASTVIDPFYRNRMESGVRAFEQGNWEAAAHQLRIACFGHLDEPELLVEGLVRLAIAEARRGDEDAFRQVFSRLIELEERFSAYRAARVSLTVREQFDELAARLVAPEDLRAVGAFQGIAERAERSRLAALPPAPRRAELEARLQAEPDEAYWLIEMAKLELTERHPRSALDWLDRLDTAAAANPPATCLRQQAGSESGDCGRMDLASPFCENVPPRVIEFRLQCLADAGRWPEASELLQELSPELRQRRRIARLERRVRKNQGDAGEGAVAATESTTVEMPPAAASPPPPSPAEPAPTASPAGEPELKQLRRRLAAATTGDELESLMGAAEELADRRPDSRQARLLAAEIAYLQSDWPRAVAHFRQTGQLRGDEIQPAFYKAVALYESGDPAAAAEVLRPVASRLERSSFVDAYVERILGPGI